MGCVEPSVYDISGQDEKKVQETICMESSLKYVLDENNFRECHRSQDFREIDFPNLPGNNLQEKVSPTTSYQVSLVASCSLIQGSREAVSGFFCETEKVWNFGSVLSLYC